MCLKSISPSVIAEFTFALHEIHSFISEMLETPYYIHYSPMRMTIHKLVTSKYFDLAISAVIGLNVITMAMEFYKMPPVRVFLPLNSTKRTKLN